MEGDRWQDAMELFISSTLARTAVGGVVLDTCRKTFTDTMLRCPRWNSGYPLRIKGDSLPFFKPAFWRLALVHACPCFFGNLGFDLPFFIFLIDRVTYVLFLWGFHFPAAQLLGFSGFLITW